jgi:hypothetical protein
MEYKLGRVAIFEVSTEPIVSQRLFVNPINQVMFVEQIVQDINKQMLETTYNYSYWSFVCISAN